MKKLRLAIFDGSSSKWSAGGEYTRTQICAILEANKFQHNNIDLFIANRSGTIPALPDDINTDYLHGVRIGISDYLSTAQIILRRGLKPLWKDPRNRAMENWCIEHKLDVVFCQMPPVWWQHKSVGVCCWIPDFQHIHLPEYFSEEEIRIRNEELCRIAEQADIVILSSESVKKDFIEFLPDYVEKVRIYRFPSQYAFAGINYTEDISVVLRRYGIKKGFFLVVNQFFAHKNHEQVIKAIAKLKNSKDCPQVVMIGQPIDYRDPSGKYLSKLFGMIAEYGVENNIKILGYVSKEEKDVLLRSCRALIQPSRFEGWNTSIEDAKALGRPVIASDIAVNREQLGDAAYGFFEIDNADELTGLMQSASCDLLPEMDVENEQESLKVAGNNAIAAGRLLINIAEEAQRK